MHQHAWFICIFQKEHFKIQLIYFLLIFFLGSTTTLNKSSDLDIIFGDSQPPHLGNGKFTRSGGSLSDADMIFGTPSSAYKTDRFGTSKSMSVTSDRSSYGQTNYKIYEGIQNAGFSDFSDSKKSDSNSSMPSYNSWRNSNKHLEEEDDIDLK